MSRHSTCTSLCRVGVVRAHSGRGLGCFSGLLHVQCEVRRPPAFSSRLYVKRCRHLQPTRARVESLIDSLFGSRSHSICPAPTLLLSCYTPQFSRFWTPGLILVRQRCKDEERTTTKPLLAPLVFFGVLFLALHLIVRRTRPRRSSCQRVRAACLVGGPLKC